jgi:hypothetical protein
LLITSLSIDPTTHVITAEVDCNGPFQPTELVCVVKSPAGLQVCNYKNAFSGSVDATHQLLPTFTPLTGNTIQFTLSNLSSTATDVLLVAVNQTSSDALGYPDTGFFQSQPIT